MSCRELSEKYEYDDGVPVLEGVLAVTKKHMSAYIYRNDLKGKGDEDSALVSETIAREINLFINKNLVLTKRHFIKTCG